LDTRSFGESYGDGVVWNCGRMYVVGGQEVSRAASVGDCGEMDGVA
jgi:hypothetical protein